MIRLLALGLAACSLSGCAPKVFNATTISAGDESAIAGEWQPRSSGTHTDFGPMTIAKDRLSFAVGGEADMQLTSNVAVLEWKSTSKSLLELCGSGAPNIARFFLTDKDQVLAADTPGQLLEVRFFLDKATLAVDPPTPNEELCRISTWER